MGNQGRLANNAKEVACLWESGATLQSIGETFGTSREAVRVHLNTRGVDTSHKKWSTPGHIKRCEWCGGVYEVSVSQISERKYCSPQCHGKARRKVSDQNKSYMQQLRRQGLSYAAIGEAIGVSTMTAWAYINPERRKKHRKNRK